MKPESSIAPGRRGGELHSVERGAVTETAQRDAHELFEKLMAFARLGAQDKELHEVEREFFERDRGR